jgi:hypothetical protein
MAAACTGQLVSAEWWGRRGAYLPALPPEAVLQDVMRDLFAAPELPSAFARGFPSPLKSAPADLLNHVLF